MPDLAALERLARRAGVAPMVCAWLTASLVLGGLIVGAIAALEILTVPPRAPLTPPRPPAHAEEQVSDVELIPGER